MPVVHCKWITRQMLKREPKMLFVFGDNMQRQGRGGQAREMRGEPNAVGVPTKNRTNLGSVATYDRSEIDYVFSWVPALGRFLVFGPDHFHRRKYIRVRVDRARNNQSRKIRYAEEFFWRNEGAHQPTG